MEFKYLSLDNIYRNKKAYYTGEIHLTLSGISQCQSGHTWEEIRSCYLVHIVVHGKGALHKKDRSWEISGGQAFCIYPGEENSYTADMEDPWEYCWIGFEGTDAAKPVHMMGFTRENPVISIGNPKSYRQSIGKLAKYQGYNYIDEMYRSGILYGILSELMREHSDIEEDVLPATATQYAEYVKEYLQAHFNEHISIEKLASKIGISREYLYRVFKEETHVSPKKYLDNYRLNTAAGKLRKDRSEEISVIARQCGYEDPLAFSRAFRKKYGECPKKYQKTEFTRKENLGD